MSTRQSRAASAGQSFTARAVGIVARAVPQLLHVDLVRYLVARARFHYFQARAGGTRTRTGMPGVAEYTVQHNLRGISDFAAARSLKLIRPLSVIETLGPESRILSIGPRAEGELLNLVAHGFRARNIRGLDLISYSPWVDLGDMHALPYADSSWDAVIVSRVLAYSTERKRAAQEILRVAKPAAIIAVGVEYNPASNEEIVAACGYLPGAENRIQNVAEILSYFEPHVDQVYFSHDVVAGRRSEVGTISTVFSVRK